MNVSLVIIIYNILYLTCDCFDYTKRFAFRIKHEIILDDYNSSDLNSIEFQKDYPDIFLIVNKINSEFDKIIHGI
jgi:GT2 family glycosyltransferase